MEEVLVPLFFFGSLFAFPLLRRQMIHRHRLELLRLDVLETTAPDTSTTAPDSAAELALRLPEPHRLYALALLCRLQDTPAEELDAHSAYLIRQARNEYLPTTLRAYLNLTPAARTRLNERGQDAEELLREQLELISGGVAGALGHHHASVDRMLTQGHFLGERFEASAVRVRT
ncbi:hypothetical protein [Deinococcus marmoris]|uniref:Uncharacterized protein n=1 Tax=Deinococcus marmoris TaxID=249408 RepID=A0A1U7NT39_9DEIO|nr:hypothetical protein [Deinococcus marmoris]OLV16082.1 hypothetical protein BOO71_0012925 [Deinococcus marmoris]